MAEVFLRAPTRAARTEAADMFARAMVLIAMVVFLVILMAVGSPKVKALWTQKELFSSTAKTSKAQPKGGPKKKGKSKKNKKGGRNTSLPQHSKRDVSAGASEEEECDLEQPVETSMASCRDEDCHSEQPNDQIENGATTTLPAGVAGSAPEVVASVLNDAKSRHESCFVQGARELECAPCSSSAPDTSLAVPAVDMSDACRLVDDAEIKISKRADTKCECFSNQWGCASHQSYSPALMLMHRQINLAAMRGPPGLELPPVASRGLSVGLKALKIDKVSEHGRLKKDMW